jgi:hypothetical protein
MKLKRFIATGLALIAITASFAAPTAFAQSDESASEATVAEAGSFTFQLWGPEIEFTPASVSSSTSQTVGLAWPNDSYPHRVMTVNDQHAYNETGFSLSISATNIVSNVLNPGGTAYFIDKSNLSVKNVGGGPHSSCLAGGVYAQTVGGNAYQTITIAPFSGYLPMSSPIGIVDGSQGRGCKSFQINLDFKLFVPAGTYTGGGSAVYTGTVTVTNTLPPS